MAPSWMSNVGRCGRKSLPTKKHWKSSNIRLNKFHSVVISNHQDEVVNETFEIELANAAVIALTHLVIEILSEWHMCIL